jgi:hypothetical protein
MTLEYRFQTGAMMTVRTPKHDVLHVSFLLLVPEDFKRKGACCPFKTPALILLSLCSEQAKEAACL